MTNTKILAFAGSTRTKSFNRRLVQIAAQAAGDAHAQVTLLELEEYPLPIFNEDLEAEGTPENATRLKEIFLEHDALLISSPEYNSSLSPLLKNTIDWVSRQSPGEKPLAAYSGKVAALLAASPGALGGLRGLVHLRSILSNIGVTVLPTQVAVPKAHEAFTDDGALVDESLHQRVRNLGSELARVSNLLRGSK